jgi:hypothetical protein
MKSKSVFAVVGAAAILAGAAPAATAAGELADYVFNVPVNVSNLGPGHRAQVQCRTLSDQAGAKGPGRMVSQQLAAVPLDAKGNFSGTISVKVPASAGVANRYECFLMLDGGTAQLPSKSATLRSEGAL